MPIEYLYIETVRLITELTVCEKMKKTAKTAKDVTSYTYESDY